MTPTKKPATKKISKAHMTRALRAPHKATAEVVRLQGDPIARKLYKLAADYNKRFFDAKLAQPLILITPPSAARTLADYCPKDAHGLESRIRIHPKVAAKGIEYAADVLLHEMVHAWANEVEDNLEEGWRHHGPVFAGKCNEISVKLKLEGIVTAKGRGEGSSGDCAHWPMNIRPKGYYPAEIDDKRVSKRRSADEVERERERERAEREREEDAEDSDVSSPAEALQKHLARALPRMTDGELYDLASLIAREMRERGARRLRGLPPPQPSLEDLAAE